MSYNIDDVRVLKADEPRISAKDALRIYKKLRADNQLPEANFLEEIEKDVADLLATEFSDADIPLEKFWWYGEGSGHCYEAFVEALTHVKGQVDLLLTWEGGDSFSGLRVSDGVVQKMDVEFKLVPLVPKKGGRK